MTEGLLKTLSEQGLLGVLLALESIAVYVLFKLLIDEKDKRVNDAKEYNESLNEPIKQIRLNVETQIVLLKQILEKLSKTSC